MVDIDKFDADEQRLSAVRQSSGNHRLHAERLPYGLDIVAALVSKYRATRPDTKLRQLRQIEDDALGEPVAQIFHLWIAARVEERQNCQRKCRRIEESIGWKNPTSSGSVRPLF